MGLPKLNNTVTRNTLSFAALVAAVLLAGVTAAPARAADPLARPNIVVILADDMGYGDCGATNPNAKIPTPHIDRLAREGLLFTDAHSASGTCTPSRYGLLTGINPARTGVSNTLLRNGKPVIAETETTIATLLRDRGYATAMVGKWHLGFDMDMSGQKPAFDFSQPLTGGPLDRGFDRFFGIHSSPGAAPYFYIDGRHPVAVPRETTAGGPQGRANKTSWGRGKIAPGYIHEEVSARLCDRAVAMIRDHAAAQEQPPFFLYYALSSPHAPWLPTKEFAGKSGVGVYGDFMVQLDHEVGRIAEALRETGLETNTLLIVTSDNGPGPDSATESQAAGHDVSGGLRGGKAMAWEGGHRVPFIVKWPGRVKPGRVSTSTINFTDLFATLAELLGVDAAAAYPGVTRDSHSFLVALFEPGTRHPRSPMVNTEDCIRIDDWKLVHPRRRQGPTETAVSKFELYNLADDLAEQNDVLAAHPEQAQRLFEQYREFIGQRKLK